MFTHQFQNVSKHTVHVLWYTTCWLFAEDYTVADWWRSLCCTLTYMYVTNSLSNLFAHVITEWMHITTNTLANNLSFPVGSYQPVWFDWKHQLEWLVLVTPQNNFLGKPVPKTCYFLQTTNCSVNGNHRWKVRLCTCEYFLFMKFYSLSPLHF